jgi:hypothetical protein
MRLFNMTIQGLIIRLFVFMLLVIGGAYIGLPWWVIIIAGMLVFLSGFFGIAAKEMEEPFRDEGKEV